MTGATQAHRSPNPKSRRDELALQLGLLHCGALRLHKAPPPHPTPNLSPTPNFFFPPSRRSHCAAVICTCTTLPPPPAILLRAPLRIPRRHFYFFPFGSPPSRSNHRLLRTDLDRPPIPTNHSPRSHFPYPSVPDSCSTTACRGAPCAFPLVIAASISAIVVPPPVLPPSSPPSACSPPLARRCMHREA